MLRLKLTPQMTRELTAITRNIPTRILNQNLAQSHSKSKVMLQKMYLKFYYTALKYVQ